MKCKLSVIIPAFNAQDYIGKCLESVLSQNGSTEFEVIVVNDGSTDDTARVVMPYCARNNNVTLVNQQNTGVSIARNNGIKQAHGEYITFVDADDMVGVSYRDIAPYFTQAGAHHSLTAPVNMKISQLFFDDASQHPIVFTNDYFENMLNMATKTNADVVLGGKITLNPDKKYIKQHVYDRNLVLGSSVSDKSTLLHQADVRESANFALYKTDFLQKNNLGFVPNIQLDEDILMCMLAVLYAERVAAVSDSTYLYYRHNDTLSNIIDCKESNDKYAVAYVQRFSILLTELAKHAKYAPLFQHWMREYARTMHSVRSNLDATIPPYSCTRCASNVCDGCIYRDAIIECAHENIHKFVSGIPGR